MSQGRRKHRVSFKAKAVLEAVKGEETVAQLAARYDVYTSQVQAGAASNTAIHQQHRGSGPAPSSATPEPEGTTGE